MLVFGPFSGVSPYFDAIYNLSSLTQAVPRLPGLIPDSIPNIHGPFVDEKDFDMWYYNYILNNPIPFKSMMTILMSVYEGNKTYVCIGDYLSDPYISIINESFMKVIQQRYGIKYSIINTISDLEYIQKDGSDFDSNEGLSAFDDDRNEFLQMQMEEYISQNGTGGLDI